REPRAAVDVAPGDAGADAAAVLGHRRRSRAGCSAGEAGVERAFEAAPAVVAAEDDAVDFLQRVLPDVADPELPGGPVEAPAPGVAESDRKDLGTGLGAAAIGGAKGIAEERVARR